MRRNDFRLVVLGLLLAGLAGCSGALPPRPPAAVELAGTLDKDGYRAMRDGDLDAARNLFSQELRLQQSLDNLPGVARSSINLATVCHQLGKDDVALPLLDGIGNETQIPYPVELRAAALFRKAVILLDAGKDDQAGTALESAAGLCAGSCDLLAGMRNMKARMALANKDYAAALDLAKSAADAAGGQKSELANAQRTSAAAEFGLGQFDSALQYFQAALAIDKELALGLRIADDLDGIARTLAQLGQKEAADGYARRAAAAHAAVKASVQ